MAAFYTQTYECQMVYVATGVGGEGGGRKCEKSSDLNF